MSKLALLLLVMTMVSTQSARSAEGERAESERTEGIALSQLIERAAVRLNKRFIVDPRVQGNVHMVGIDPDRITYGELQAVLQVHGFMTTQEANGVIEIIPDAQARQLPMPVLNERGAKVGDDEFVTKVIDVGPLRAVQLVPILRPLLPQYAHMVAEAQTNGLIVVARYENIRQIEAIIAEMKRRPVVAPPPAAE